VFQDEQEQIGDLLSWYALPAGHGPLAAYASAR
jgi:hypothetical protein